MGFNIYQYYIDDDILISYIGLEGHSKSDSYLADLLGMTLQQYRKLLKSYNAIEHWTGCVFLEETDAQKFIDYLNKKYLLILRLANKI